MTTAIPVKERLQALPRKVGVPLSGLLELGYVDEEVLARVLDAGELAGDSSRLMGFAIGYLYLQSHGTPVGDVIRMACSQKRRIRLDWSVGRWKTEHDRLSHAETLLRLTEANCRYDLKRYQALIPAGCKGYLIRSSHRLGMEGLRQHHCVASYHQRIAAGHCAIASVFVNRRRWTVELALTIEDEQRLCIVQIRSRYDRFPSAEERTAVYAMLGIQEAVIPVTDGGGPRSTYMDDLRCVLPVLRQHQVSRVSLSFDGSGDEGAIERFEFVPEGFDPSRIEVQIVAETPCFENGQWISAREMVCRDLEDALEQLTGKFLDEANVNWYDNEGGFGELVIDVAAGTVRLEVNVRTESSCEYSSTRDIASGEELE